MKYTTFEKLLQEVKKQFKANGLTFKVSKNVGSNNTHYNFKFKLGDGEYSLVTVFRWGDVVMVDVPNPNPRAINGSFQYGVRKDGTINMKKVVENTLAAIKSIESRRK